MEGLENYVLLLGEESDDLNALESSLNCLRCSVEIANSEDQAVARASQTLPYLVILDGDRQHWSTRLVSKLRQKASDCGTTIVALTDFNAPSWSHQEDNPGVDGFLVKPIDGDVLCSLVHSARAKQNCCDAVLACG